MTVNQTKLTWEVIKQNQILIPISLLNRTFLLNYIQDLKNERKTGRIFFNHSYVSTSASEAISSNKTTSRIGRIGIEASQDSQIGAGKDI